MVAHIVVPLLVSLRAVSFTILECCRKLLRIDIIMLRKQASLVGVVEELIAIFGGRDSIILQPVEPDVERVFVSAESLIQNAPTVSCRLLNERSQEG
jgi:hypothetical protein